jgi:hypothetical protein
MVATVADFGGSLTETEFTSSAGIPCGSVSPADARRVASVRRTLASAGVSVFTAVSILPATGANTDADMASNAIAIIMPPWA